MKPSISLTDYYYWSIMKPQRQPKSTAQAGAANIPTDSTNATATTSSTMTAKPYMNVATLSFRRDSDRFSVEDENLFLLEYYQTAREYLYYPLLLGCLLLFTYGILDVLLAPSDEFRYLFAERFGVMLPLYIIFAVAALKIPQLTPYFVCGCVLALGIGHVVAVARVKEYPQVTYLYFGVVFAILYGFACVRLRFVHATATGWVLALTILYVTVSYSDMNLKQILRYHVVLAVSIGCGMLCSYDMEKSIRFDWILLQKVNRARLSLLQEKVKSDSLITSVLPKQIVEKLMGRKTPMEMLKDRYHASTAAAAGSHLPLQRLTPVLIINRRRRSKHFHPQNHHQHQHQQQFLQDQLRHQRNHQDDLQDQQQQQQQQQQQRQKQHQNPQEQPRQQLYCDFYQDVCLLSIEIFGFCELCHSHPGGFGSNSSSVNYRSSSSSSSKVGGKTSTGAANPKQEQRRRYHPSAVDRSFKTYCDNDNGGGGRTNSFAVDLRLRKKQELLAEWVQQRMSVVEQGGLTHVQVATFLNEWFDMLDDTAAHHRLEKIRTCNSTYVAAVGVHSDVHEAAHKPFWRVDAALRAAAGAHAAMDRLNAAHQQQYRLCVSVHVGSVVAGVVGFKRVFYDLFGRAAAVAEHVHAHALPGPTITVSSAVHDVMAIAASKSSSPNNNNNSNSDDSLYPDFSSYVAQTSPVGTSFSPSLGFIPIYTINLK